MTMIVPSRSFCFVKVPKTAGSSVEAYLSRFFTDTYISSPQGPVAEMDKIIQGGAPSMGYKQAVYSNPTDFVRKKMTRLAKVPHEIRLLHQIFMTDSTQEKIDAAILLAKSQANVQPHMCLGELEQFVDKEFPGQQFSFHAFIRNPYDHAFSHFTYLLTKKGDPTGILAEDLVDRFKQFLRRSYKPQKYWLVSDRSICTIHKFENLEEESQRLRDLIIAETEPMEPVDSRNRFPRLLENRYKSFFKPLKQRLLDDESRDIISRKSRWEFENHYPDSI